jgi:hypothetical protein
MNDGLHEVFGQLRPILAAYELAMAVKHDEPDAYYLDTRHMMKNGQPLFFASVAVKKNYVSFHLMPVYAFPDLLDDIGELKTRM